MEYMIRVVDITNKKYLEDSRLVLFKYDLVDKEIIERCPHRKVMGDLVAFISVGFEGSMDKEKSLTAVIVSKKAIEEQGYKCDECYEMALKNTPLRITSSYGMPVARTTALSELYGAASVINKFDAIAAAVGETYAIIPSSIHEMIILPMTIEESTRQEIMASLMTMDQMVRDVNNSDLTPDRILSDHAYVFSKGKLYTSALEFAQVLKKEVNAA